MYKNKTKESILPNALQLSTSTMSEKFFESFYLDDFNVLVLVRSVWFIELLNWLRQNIAQLQLCQHEGSNELIIFENYINH